jgi:hypothetical protein
MSTQPGENARDTFSIIDKHLLLQYFAVCFDNLTSAWRFTCTPIFFTCGILCMALMKTCIQYCGSRVDKVPDPHQRI